MSSIGIVPIAANIFRTVRRQRKLRKIKQSLRQDIAGESGRKPPTATVVLAQNAERRKAERIVLMAMFVWFADMRK